MCKVILFILLTLSTTFHNNIMQLCTIWILKAKVYNSLKKEEKKALLRVYMTL